MKISLAIHLGGQPTPWRQPCSPIKKGTKYFTTGIWPAESSFWKSIMRSFTQSSELSPLPLNPWETLHFPPSVPSPEVPQVSQTMMFVLRDNTKFDWFWEMTVQISMLKKNNNNIFCPIFASVQQKLTNPWTWYSTCTVCVQSPGRVRESHTDPGSFFFLNFNLDSDVKNMIRFLICFRWDIIEFI